jgi:hypothetical protein
MQREDRRDLVFRLIVIAHGSLEAFGWGVRGSDDGDGEAQVQKGTAGAQRKGRTTFKKRLLGLSACCGKEGGT